MIEQDGKEQPDSLWTVLDILKGANAALQIMAQQDGELLKRLKTDLVSLHLPCRPIVLLYPLLNRCSFHHVKNAMQVRKG